ncbi:hypothetical protein [Amycolatopsis nigrescens]|uniref:hypothetical protein n=1 Tax=Amycolatopsis nigrescens TaxID=381445 RepID=UPI00037BAC97|nr:hypothetical protein [Amycolatopsis nigrescens]
MGWKIEHLESEQELPFPTRQAALAYAEEHGGLDRWALKPTQVPVSKVRGFVEPPPLRRSSRRTHG